MGLPLQPSDAREHEAALAVARAALTELTSAGAWAEGQALSLEQAIDYALEPDRRQ